MQEINFWCGNEGSEIEWSHQFSFAVEAISWLWRILLPVCQLCKGDSV